MHHKPGGFYPGLSTKAGREILFTTRSLGVVAANNGTGYVGM